MGPAFTVRMAGTFPTMATWARSIVIGGCWIFDPFEFGIGIDVPMASFAGRSVSRSRLARAGTNLVGFVGNLAADDTDLGGTASNGSRSGKGPIHCRPASE